jgi:hypothetical protein
MLKKHHKSDLFEWLHVHARRLHVLFIANRKDNYDLHLLGTLRKDSAVVGVSPDRIKVETTRLGRTLLNEVMDKRNIKPEHKAAILRWMHCSRCLFGGEAVSLRGIDKLRESLERLEANHTQSSSNELVNLVLNKVPTVSEATAQEFVTCFLASLHVDDTAQAISKVVQVAKGSVSLMIQASLLTESIDTFGTDYPDFVTGLERAYSASPALRIAAWCCQMIATAKAKIGEKKFQEMLSKMDSPKAIFQSTFVDQCGFPLQLEDENNLLGLSEGLAFSWGGDYTSMRDIIDAVKHGHSVDWADVHKRCWKRDPVQDISLLVELLSVCTSPAKVLEALTEENLCTLLKKSNHDDAQSLAQQILKYQTYKDAANKDTFKSPYRTAVWMTILYDKSLSRPDQILMLMGTGSLPADASAALDTRESDLADALAWASTNMRDMTTVRSDDDPKKRLKFLIDTLVHLSHRLIDTANTSRVARLWNDIFEPLLSISHEALSAPKSQNRIVVHVAIHAENNRSKWREPLPSLWAIAHDRGTAAQVDKIWKDHRYLLFDGDSLVPRLAGGILCVLGIPIELQEVFLTTNCDVDMSHIENQRVCFLKLILSFCTCFPLSCTSFVSALHLCLIQQSQFLLKLWNSNWKYLCFISILHLQESEQKAINLIRGALERFVKQDKSKIKIKEVFRILCSSSSRIFFM